MKRFFLFGLVMAMSLPSHAFKCYITAMKDNCWDDYTVNITILDAVTKKPIMPTIDIPKGKNWGRQAFECKPMQSLIFSAKYSPAIWEHTEGDIYYGKRIVYLPREVKKDKEVAWNVPVCFTRDFTRAPLPPTAKGSCSCDFKSVPAIEAK